jgi:hypothetical protein
MVTSLTLRLYLYLKTSPIRIHTELLTLFVQTSTKNGITGPKVKCPTLNIPVPITNVTYVYIELIGNGEKPTHESVEGATSIEVFTNVYTSNFVLGEGRTYPGSYIRCKKA